MRRTLSMLISTMVLICTCSVAGMMASAASKDYVRLIEDFEVKDRVDSYSTYDAQKGMILQSTKYKNSGKNSGLFVSQSAYGAVLDHPNFNNKVRLTYDNEPMTSNKSNTIDAIRMYFVNPGAPVTFRMQFTSSLATTYFLDKEIPSTTKFVAVDFPLKDFHKTNKESGKTFKDATDPLDAEIWEMIYVYVSADVNLKLYLDDLSFVKYNFKAPTTTAATTTTTVATTTTTTQLTTTSTEAVSTQTSAVTTDENVTLTGTTTKSVSGNDSSGMPGWLIPLIIAVVIAAGGGTAAFLILKKKKTVE